VPPLCDSYTLAFALQLRKKHGKILSQGKKNLSQVKKNLSQSTEKPQSKYIKYILPKTPTHYKTLTNTHITKPTHTHTRAHTQNNIKPPQYKLKQNAYRKNNIMGRKNTTYFLMLILRYCTPFLTGPSLHFTSPTINTLHGTPRFNPLHCTVLHFTSIHCTF